MKARLTKDEWYPVYDIIESENSIGETVEIPDHLVAEHKAAAAAFDAVQRELDKLYRTYSVK